MGEKRVARKLVRKSMTEKLKIEYVVHAWALINPVGNIQPFYSKTYGISLPTISESKEKIEKFIGSAEAKAGFSVGRVRMVVERDAILPKLDNENAETV